MDSFAAPNIVDDPELVEPAHRSLFDDKFEPSLQDMTKYAEENVKRVFDIDLMASNDYEIALIVDNREKRNATDLNYFFDKLRANKITAELRSLPLGDFVWVIRIRNEGVNTSKKKKDYSEYVLDFIMSI